MKHPLAKIIIFLLITTSIFLSFISISCDTDEKVISIKKTIVPVNNTNAFLLQLSMDTTTLEGDSPKRKASFLIL